MEENFTVHSIQADAYQTKTKTYQGKKHLVVPVVMMVEGVHSGSAGAILHLKEELEKFVEAWNGRPVTIDHPEENGTNLSAAERPDILERSVGVLFNTCMEDGKLKAEAWLDIEKLQAMSPEALNYIKQNRPLDVSVGVFTDQDATEGKWNGETYVSIARNYRPDHLALLPGGTGACSWNDGCGVRTNRKGGHKVDLLQTFKQLNKEGFSVLPITNTQGYLELMNLVRAKLDSMDNDLKVYYLTEIFNDHIIYTVDRREEQGQSILYRQNYQLTDQDTKVEFLGDPVEVRRNVEYLTMSMRRTEDPQSNNNKGGEIMTKEKSLCCLTKIEQLIDNRLTHFAEADKEWLLTQEEVLIDKLFPIEQKPAPVLQVNREKALEVLELKTTDDYIAGEIKY